jgi:dihydroneopterin aldolase/2-amino-4-hydroxy-6-hydroxymethyldihydropteridine diphosphokinase
MNEVLLGLGSNIGERKKNINSAIQYIRAHDLIEVVKNSSIIETKPVSKVKQPDFLNAAILIRTILTPRELLEYTQCVEETMGRDSKSFDEPRIIDIDILLYGQEIICEDDLVIPHQFLHEREFVLTPLNEISPEYVHPIFGETISSLYKNKVY